MAATPDGARVAWFRGADEKFPNLVAVEKSYRERGLRIFAISHDTKRDRWLEAIEIDGIGSFTHASQLRGIGNEITNAYGIRGIPANFLIDGDGTIVGADLFGAVLDAKLAELYLDGQKQKRP